MKKFNQTKRFATTIEKIKESAIMSDMRYAIEGGNAINFYTNPPVTEDIDILVMGKKTQFDIFIYTMSAKFNVRIDEFYDELDFAMVFMTDKKSNVEIDIKYFPTDELYVEAIKQSNNIKGVNVIRPEYLLIMKLMAYRDRKLKKDLFGAVKLIQWGIRKMNRKILSKWLKRENLLGLFNLVLKTSVERN